MPKFRRKQTEIEAMRYVGPEEDTSQTRADVRMLEDWGAPVSPTEHWGGNCGEEKCDKNWDIFIETPTGTSTVRVGDWVGKQPIDENDWDFWPISNEQFQKTYEAMAT